MKPDFYTYTVIAVITTSQVSAAEFCDSVITNRAFNTTNTEEQASIYNRARSELCQESWSTYQEFRSSAQQLGVDIGYAAFSFGLSGGEATSDERIQQARDRYCSMSDSEFSSDYAKRSDITIADYAVKAWSGCAEAYLASVRQGVFATITDGPDYRYFDIKFLFRTEGDQRLSLRALHVSNPAVKVTCSEGDREIAAGPKNPYEFVTNAATIRCVKSSPVRTLNSVNTNAGPIDGIISYGQSVSVYEREQLMSAVQSLQTEIGTLQDRIKGIEETAERIGELEQALQSQSGTVATVKQKLEDEILADKFTLSKTREGCPEGFTSLGEIGVLLNQKKYEKVGLGGFGGTYPPSRIVDPKAEYIWIHPFLCGR